MKKITLFVFAIAALSFASCKKARTCTCTNTTSGTTTHSNGAPTTSSQSGSYTTAFVTTTKLSKKSAKGICASGKEVETEVTTTSADTKTEITTTDRSCTVK